MAVIVPIAQGRSLSDMKARIADEIARSDLTNQIANAITDAIDEASRNRFWFQEVRGLAIPLQAGAEYYDNDITADLLQVDAAWTILTGSRRNLYEVGNGELDSLADGSVSAGIPYAFSRYGGQLRLYPVPNDAVTLFIDGALRLAGPISNPDVTPWTQEGERYVRSLAKRELYAHVIQDSEMASAMDAMAERYRSDLLSVTSSKSATNTLASYG